MISFSANLHGVRRSHGERRSRLSRDREKAILYIEDRVCETPHELLSSRPFQVVLGKAIAELSQKRSPLLRLFGEKGPTEEKVTLLTSALRFLAKMPLDALPSILKGVRNWSNIGLNSTKSWSTSTTSGAVSTVSS